VDVYDRLHQPVETFTAQPRSCHDGHAFHLWQPMIDFLPQLGGRAGAALGQIPLVHRHHERAAFAHDKVRNAEILFFERLLRIHQEHDYLGKADSSEGVRN